jgi:hypothetical protein
MDMPKLTADHKRLEKLAGIWKGTETMHPSPWDRKGGQADAITKSRVALGGFAIISDYEQSRGGAVTYQGHGVYTWDAKANQVVLHWFDGMGCAVDEFRGEWKGDRLVLQCKNQMGHFRMTADYSKPGAMTSGMESSQDGKSWSKMFDGTYRRAD